MQATNNEVEEFFRAIWDSEYNGYHGRTDAETLEIIKDYIVNKKIDVNVVSEERDNRGQTPLFSAAGTYRIAKDIVESLIIHGANVNYVMPQLSSFWGGFTPLCMAAFRGNSQVIPILVKSGADINHVVSNSDLFAGQTPLSIAIKEKNWGASYVLIECGADVNIVINTTPNEALLELTSSLEDTYLNVPNKSQSEEQAKVLSAIILLRQELYNRSKANDATIRAPEEGAHDISFAKESLSQVKTYFAENNQQNIPTFDVAVSSIQEMIIARIQESDATPELKNSLTPYNKENFLANFDRNDISHLAFLWISSFQDSMMLRSDPAMPLVKEMLSYIVACRDNLKINGDVSPESIEIENALILQLSNLMQANEGQMSCAPGTPRGLKDVLNAYMRIKQPQQSQQSQQSQHEQVMQSAFNIINKRMLDIFKNLKNNTKLAVLFNAIESREITTLSKEERERIDKIKNMLKSACDAMAVIGSDNIAALLQEGSIDGVASDKKLSAIHVVLRAANMRKAYPTYDSFEAAVVANMRISPEQHIRLSGQDKAYLRLQYVAISNEEIRPKLYETLDAELTIINTEISKFNAPGAILDAINAYKSSLSNVDKQKLKQTLSQSLSLLVADVDLEARDNVISEIIKDIPNYRNNLSALDAKQLFNRLKTDYDAAVNQPASPRLRF